MDTFECEGIAGSLDVANEDGSSTLIGRDDALYILFPGSVFSLHVYLFIFYKWNSKVSVMVWIRASYFKNIHINNILPFV